MHTIAVEAIWSRLGAHFGFGLFAVSALQDRVAIEATGAGGLSALAVRNGSGGTQCACTKETLCPPAKACQLAQCGESCSKAWAGNPCPLAGDTTATGICSADGNCLAP